MQEIVCIVAKIASTTFVDDLAVPFILDSFAHSKLEWWMGESIECILAPKETHHLARLMTLTGSASKGIAGNAHLLYWK